MIITGFGSSDHKYDSLILFLLPKILGTTVSFFLQVLVKEIIAGGSSKKQRLGTCLFDLVLMQFCPIEGCALKLTVGGNIDLIFYRDWNLFLLHPILLFQPIVLSCSPILYYHLHYRVPLNGVCYEMNIFLPTYHTNSESPSESLQWHVQTNVHFSCIQYG